MNRYKILIADDDPETVERIIDFLTHPEVDYQFFQALNGKTAYSIAEKKLPDLIISDWEMPETNGIELIKQLQQNHNTKDIPVIMCTGVMTTAENLKTALEAGAVDYIRKPVEKLELTARVYSMLKLSESMRKIKEQNHKLIEQKEEIETQNQSLSELNATKNKFFSIISHDLRGAFSGITGLSELLLQNLNNTDTGEIQNFLSLIYNASKNSFSLLENLLDWSRSQMNKINIEPEPLQLSPIVNEVLKVLYMQAENKTITFKTETITSKRAYADKNMIKTILRNLVSNAVKFTPKQGTITIEAIEKEKEIEIAVKDTGIGMNEVLLSKLFKICEKVVQPGTEDEEGTGLGLILCKEFAEKQGGKISVESTLGKGSTFKFTVPVYNECETSI